MLVKARFEQELGLDAIDYQFLFTISEEDLILMGISSIRDYDPKHRRFKVSKNLTGELYDEVCDLHDRAFVARCPFRPDCFENMEPYPGQMHRLQPGDYYWVLLEGPFQTNETVDHKVAKQKLSHSVYNVAAIYPYVNDVQGFDEYLEQVEDMPSAYYHTSNVDPLVDKLRGTVHNADVGLEKKLNPNNMDWWFRLWSAVLAFPITQAAIDEGNRLYSSTNNIVAIEKIYKHFAKTTSDAKSHHYLHGTPLVPIISELSDPSEFGAMGVLLPYAMIANPYAFVGPSSNPGVSSSSGASATTKLFPYWMVDIFARAAYEINYKHPARCRSLVNEAIRHLELRNHQAFSKYAEARISWNETFNFDKDGITPSGSTIFSKATIQAAVIRRNKELELVRKGVLKRVYIGTDYFANPYRSLAGFLGQPLDLIPVNEAISQKTLDAVTSPTIKVETSDKQRVYKWRGLKSRVATSENLVDLILDQTLSFDAENMLRVRPPLTTAIPDADQKVLTPSQAAASRMVIRNRISCVTGEPGTGKSYYLHEFDRYSKELTNAGNITLLLFLTPTNTASSRICDLFPSESLYVLGGEEGEDEDIVQSNNRRKKHEDDEEKEEEQFTFRIAVGTIDSFLGKIKSCPNFRSYLRERNAILGIDECSMVTAEKFIEIMEIFRDADNNTISDRLLRLILLGDPIQLESVEPGNFYTDALRFLPVTQLTEQMRYASDNPNIISLETLFTKIRKGMTNEDARVAAVKIMQNLDRNPALGGNNLRVYMLDDIPDSEPPLDESDLYWEKFVGDLEQKVQDIVFSEILNWNQAALDNNMLTPRLPVNATPQEIKAGFRNYQLFREALTQPAMPFQIISLVRKARSGSGQTEYISSSDRINGWIHDALLGRLPQPIGFKSYPLPRNERMLLKSIGQSKVWSAEKNQYIDYDTALAQFKGNRTKIKRFLTHNRQPCINLFPEWPYTVQSTAFKKYKVYRGNIIRYVKVIQKRNRNYYVFRSPTGKEFAVSPRYCTPAHLTYGWATHVHQVQGAEYPLVVLIWLDGICFPFISSNYSRLRDISPESLTKPLDKFKFGGFTMGSELASLDDKLNTRSYYTAATRTALKNEVTQNLLDLDKTQVTNKIGRCVLVVGKHAARRYLSLHSHDRQTPTFGMIWNRINQLEDTQ